LKNGEIHKIGINEIEYLRAPIFAKTDFSHDHRLRGEVFDLFTSGS
jgi:hypothetical protein